MPLIALFTDFGLEGPYIGQMKAVLAEQAPGVTAVDVFPDLPPFNVRAAAYLLPAYCQTLPASAISLCVVDPGVGGQRRGLIVEADGRRFVGPDNGLFSLLIRRAMDARVHAIEWRPEQSMSATFHGRDWFAPVAARLLRGETVANLATPVADAVMPDWPEELAEIVYVDHFGNAMTGIRAVALPERARVRVGDYVLSHARTYSERGIGDCFWYENSNGLVELAANRGAVSALLNLSVGDHLRIENAP